LVSQSTNTVAQNKEVLYEFLVGSSVNCSCLLKVNSVGIQNATACDKADGQILISVTGGSGSYTYSWTDAANNIIATTSDLSNVPPGFYFVSVTDQNGVCTGQKGFEVGSDLQILSTITSNMNCVSPTGAIAVSAVGGSGLYTYSWRLPDGSTIVQKNIGALKGGQYTLTVTDTQKGCTLTQAFTVKNLVNLNLAALSQTGNTSCITPNGSINLSITGGSGNYKFYWYDLAKGSYQAYTKDLSSAKGGDYSFYAIDENSGCTAYQFFTLPDLTQKPTYTVSAEPNSSCSSPFDGSISLTPGGTPGPFSISWTDGITTIASSTSPTGLAPGKYGFTLTDQITGCNTVVSAAGPEGIVVVDESTPAGTVENVTIAASSNCLSPNGSISVEPSDNAYPVTYAWSGPDNFSASTQAIGNLAPGLYRLRTTVPCTLNQPPVITQTALQSIPNAPVRISLMEIVSDPDLNLDPATLEVTQAPKSGASYSIDDEYVLTLQYNKSYKGQDNLRLRACDLLNACSEQVLFINVNQDGELIVYNAVAPASTGDNKFLRILNLPDATNHVTIFNRWGDAVFEVVNYDNEDHEKRFEGFSRTGQRLPSGTYFYKIEIEGAPARSGYLALKQ
jgi:hypothetical protein